MAWRVVREGAVVGALVFLAAACVAGPTSQAPASRLPIVLADNGGQPDLASPVARIAFAPAAPRPDRQLQERKILEAYANLPLAFEANRGQEPPDVRFLARGRAYTVFLTAAEAVVALTAPAGPTPFMRPNEVPFLHVQNGPSGPSVT